MTLILWIALAFLIGSIPVGFLFAKAKGLDIRSEGSGNIGATNVSRVLGFQSGVIVFILDVLKGAAVPAAIQAGKFTGEWGISAPDLAAVSGIAAVAGHMLTPWLGFRGGKGIATGLGALLGTAPLVGLGGFSVWLGVMFMTHYVSVASIISVIGVLGFGFLLNQTPFFLVLYSLLGFYVWYKHIPNVKRLLKGEESKFTIQGKPTAPVEPPAPKAKS
jgi:acyl phosphate:glycerol-3-phosphate acyltransferase